MGVGEIAPILVTIAQMTPWYAHMLMVTCLERP